MITPLRRLRIRLAAWFTAIHVGIFLVLGASLLWAVSRELSRELQDDLERTLTESVAGARILEAEGSPPPVAVIGAAAEFRTPVRPVIVYGPDETRLGGDAVPQADSFAVEARRAGHADGRFVAEDGTTWWVHAERFDVGDDGPFVEMVLENATPLERRYGRILGAFLTAGLGAVVLAGLGGYRLSRLSTEPVEESMDRTRRLVADLAHELRTPLAVMRAQVDVALRREREGADYAATLHRVGQETERLSRVTDDLLLLARADAGQRRVAREPLFLDDVVSDAVSGARALAEARGVTLELPRYEETPVMGDTDLLHRLTMILLDNAIHYTPRGRRVVVGVHPEGEHAVLEVADEGEGISAEALPRVFDRFFRADASRAGAGGAGLGLSIARWIATEHGGTLALDSESGRGARATFRIPLGSVTHL
jgi:signal transduction histidine kinase